MTIKASLRYVFLIFMMIILGSSLFARYNLITLGASVNFIVKDLLLENNMFSEIDANVNNFRILEADHILSMNTQEMDKKEKEMSDIKENVTKLMTQVLAPNNLSNEDKIITEGLQNTWNQYLEVNSQMLPLSRKYDSIDHLTYLQQATTLYNEKSSTLYEKINVLARNLVDDKLKIINDTAQNTAIFVSQSIYFNMILAVFACCFSLAIIIFFEKKVVSFLVNLTDIVKQVAEGNNNVKIEGEGRKDELGSIARALVIFKKNALDNIHLEEEQAKKETMNKQQKELDKQKLAADFEATVQSIIKTVARAT